MTIHSIAAPAGPTLAIGQSGGATAAINASLAGVLSTAQASGAFPRILGMRNGVEGLLGDSFHDLSAIDAATIDGLRRTPSSALGTGRHKLKEAELDDALAILANQGITALVYIGGNDSADTAHRLAEHAALRKQALQVIHVPKTVDNDLLETDFCPGYPSMAKALATYVRDATWDTLANPELYPVKFIEVVGRDAGWVAAAATLGFTDAEIAAGLAPRVYIPEARPDSPEDILAAVGSDLDERGWSIIIVPETLTYGPDVPEDGVPPQKWLGRHFGGEEPEWIDPHGHKYYPSAGLTLKTLTSKRFADRKVVARFEKPGSALRMAMALASPVDLAMAEALGAEAVSALLRGETAVMTAVQRTHDAPYAAKIVTAPVERIANEVRTLPVELRPTGMLDGNPTFRSWALPLLGPDPFLPYIRLP